MSQPLRLLLVEDDELDAINVRRAFRDSEVVEEVLVAEDGVEALELLRGGQLPLDRLVVLLDLNMPRMGGIELLRELRADDALSWLPVVVLTTSSDERDRDAAWSLNVAGYMVKPVTRDKFLACMRSLEAYWSQVEFR